MEYEYKPDVADQDGNPLFEGSIQVRLPTRKERKAMREAVAKLEADQIEEYMMDIAEKSIVKMDVKTAKFESRITSFDDLLQFQEGFYVALKLGEIQTTGIALGEGLANLLGSK